MTPKQTLKVAAITAIAFATIQSIGSQAGAFGAGYQNQDLLLNFRQFPAGGPAGTFDVTFDLGNVNTFLGNYSDKRIQINSAGYMVPNAFNASLLTGAGGGNYGSLNNLRFGVTATDVTASVDDMWATRLRGPSTDNSVADSTAWTRKTALNQATPAGKIRDVGANADNFGTSLSSTAAKTTDSSAQGYNTISAGGVFGSYFVGSTEGFTGSAFGSSDSVRLDFYQVNHTTFGTSPSTYKGYFELEGDGDLFFVGPQFVAVPEPSTYGLFAGVGLLAFGLRRKFAHA